jgi:2-iminobutanoate/2-iminopropanoate deaminase
MKEIINTPQAPAAIGPYNQAVVFEKMVYTSGNISLDEKGELVGGDDVRKQAEQVFKNLAAVLEASGSSLKNVIKTTCFLKNMNDFVAFNAVYASYFDAEMAPARSTVEVARLPKNVLVEVEAIAYIS